MPTSPYRDWFFLNPEFLRSGTQLRAYGGPPGPALDLSSTELGGGRDGSASLRDLGYQAWWDLPALPKLNVRNPETREYLLGAAEHWIRLGVDGWRLDVPEDVEDPDFWREFRARDPGDQPRGLHPGRDLVPDGGRAPGRPVRRAR